jgi:hypothetical protein
VGGSGVSAQAEGPDRLASNRMTAMVFRNLDILHFLVNSDGALVVKDDAVVMLIGLYPHF